MKKIFSFGLVLVFLTGCTQEPVLDNQITETALPEVETLVVDFATEQAFILNGEVTAINSATLSSQVRADVKTIQVQPGDSVQTGDVLIYLDSESIQESFKTAAENLENARKTHTQTILNADQNLKSAKNNLEKTELSLKNLLTQNEKARQQAEATLKSSNLNLDLSLDSGNSALLTAQSNLEKTKALNNSSLQTVSNNLQNSISAADTTIQATITTLDELLGISLLYENKNDSFESALGALSSQTKTDAKTALRNLMISYESSSKEYDSIYNVLKQAETSTQKTLTMLNFSTSNANFSQTTLDAYISKLTTQLSSVRNSISALTSSKTAYNQTVSANAASLNSAEKSVENAQKSLNAIKQETNGESQVLVNAQLQYENTLIKLQSAEDDANKQLQSAQIAYNSAVSSSSILKTNAASAITNAEGNFEQAKINLENLIIRAPFEGQIVDVSVKEGDEVNPGTALVQIENNQLFKIVAYLTPQQASKVKVGGMVEINPQTQTKITALSSGLDPNLKKYKVEILHQNSALHSGQIIPLKFKLNAEQNLTVESVYIPLEALHITPTESFVWTLDTENQTVKTEVKIGEIVADKIEILSGLQEGDMVVIKGGRLLEKEGVKVLIHNSAASGK